MEIYGKQVLTGWSFSRVEERRGNAGMMPSSRFLSPLIEPDVQISRIRLSDWFRVRLTAASTA